MDPIAYHLSRTLESIIDCEVSTSSLLVDQVLSAMRYHLASRYGGLVLPSNLAGRLTPQQVQNVRAIMLDDPKRSVRLGELASACGMPVHLFKHAFRKQFGSSPHRWRQAAKVNHAKTLLAYTDSTLADIAMKCGFSDQAHLTRTFLRMLGVTPGSYRRARRR